MSFGKFKKIKLNPHFGAIHKKIISAEEVRRIEKKKLEAEKNYPGPVGHENGRKRMTPINFIALNK